MRFHIPLIFISSSILCLNTDKNSSLSHLPDMLQKLCPGTRVCRENQTSVIPLTTIRPGYESCCTECSCAPDCNKDGNCCFPRENHTKKSANVECLFPTSVQPSREQRISYRSYFMISSAPDSSFSTNSTASTSCGDENVVPWGSLYPVYSPTQKRIYKNSICAKAHGVEDGQLWDAKILCKTTKDGIKLDATSFVLGLDSNSIHGSCLIEFSFKGVYEDIRHFTCYTDLVHKCSDTDFQIPDVIDASREEVIEACRSGLVSPYRQDTLYANAFCLICNGAFFRKDKICRVLKDSASRSGSWKGFIGLIDDTFIAGNRHETPRPIKYPRACHIHDKQTLQTTGCRIVFCPSGKLRDIRGNCRYPTRLWYQQIYIITIILTAEEKVNIYEVFEIKPGDYSPNLPNLISPWQKKWKIAAITLNILRKNENITTLMADLIVELSAVKPDDLINYIKRVVKRDWYLRHNNVTYTFKSDFKKYKDVFPQIGIESAKYIGNLSDSPLSFSPMYMRAHMYTKNMLKITKLYMCDQVELTDSDFVLSENKNIIYNKLTGQMMHSDEYALLTKRSDGDFIARVCVEDSGLYRLDQYGFSNGRNLDKSYFLQLLVALLMRQCAFYITK